MRKKVFLASITIIFLSLSLYRLDQLPGEWFGDISNVQEYVSGILRGQWPFYFFQSPGPVYHYLISPFIFFTGAGYLNYKIASFTVAFLGLISTYFLAKSLSASAKKALLAMGISAISFPYLVWARLGNSQIIIPLLSSLTILFALKTIRRKNLQNLFLGIFFSGVGLFTYPQTFVLPVVFLSILLMNISGKDRKNIFKFLLIAVICYIPLVLLFLKVLLGGNSMGIVYIGPKVAVKAMSIQTFINMEGERIWKTLAMFIYRGDETFRINVSGSPELDRISALFLIFGVLACAIKEKKKTFILLVSFFILILPSVSPGIPDTEIPSASRTIAVLPLLFYWTSEGIFFIYSKINRRSKITFILLPAFIILTFMNIHKYFIQYSNHLPDHNIPMGRIIADYIDSFPKETQIHMTSCCWGESGQPEPKAIYYSLKNQKGRENIVGEAFISSCKSAEKTEGAVYIFNPSDQEMIRQFRICLPEGIYQEYKKGNQSIFSSLYLP